ncbi:hypothetical protein AK812_SmicGene10188 [Symbiodinium microadriaticum]|uniref:Ubiquitin-like protease family profile domain-containing protein n=1 Tax=Symbiodinium microadriaticum TaxID=2951 RepID=A0A1Q9EGJ4_SYMMI|nr:hypothetical protein AK812_SmicGene10188 [Symbiodinium microadriaticum]
MYTAKLTEALESVKRGRIDKALALAKELSTEEAAYAADREAREMAVGLAVAGSTFEIPGPELECRDVTLIRPRQLVEGFWLRKISDQHEAAESILACNFSCFGLKRLAKAAVTLKGLDDEAVLRRLDEARWDQKVIRSAALLHLGPLPLSLRNQTISAEGSVSVYIGKRIQGDGTVLPRLPTLWALFVKAGTHIRDALLSAILNLSELRVGVPSSVDPSVAWRPKDRHMEILTEPRLKLWFVPEELISESASTLFDADDGLDLLGLAEDFYKADCPMEVRQQTVKIFRAAACHSGYHQGAMTCEQKVSTKGAPKMTRKERKKAAVSRWADGDDAGGVDKLLAKGLPAPAAATPAPKPAPVLGQAKKKGKKRLRPGQAKRNAASEGPAGKALKQVRVLFPELLSGSPTAGRQRAWEMQRLSPPKTPRKGGKASQALLGVRKLVDKISELAQWRQGTRRLLTAVGQPLAEATKGSSTEASKEKAAPKQAKSARGPKASTELTEVPAPKDTVAEAKDVRLSAVAAAPADDSPLAAPAALVEAPLKRRRSACEEAQQLSSIFATAFALFAHESAAPSGDDDVAFSWSALRVTRRDLACLEEGNMLNDAVSAVSVSFLGYLLHIMWEVVDFFLQLMTSQLLPNSDIHLFSTHFYTRLTAAQAANGMIGWENVKGWTKKTSWLALIRLDVPGPRLFFLDSLEGEDSRYQSVLSFLGGYLQREWSERGAAGIDMDFGALALTPETRLKSDEQENGQSLSAVATGLRLSMPSVDCGVFLLDNVLRLLQQTSRGSQLDQIAWCTQEAATRRRIALRRTAWRLQELGGDISALLPARPDVLAKLRVPLGPKAAPKLPLCLEDDDASGAEDLTMECCDQEEPAKKRVRARKRGTQGEKQAERGRKLSLCKKGHTMGQRTDNPPAYKNEASLRTGRKARDIKWGKVQAAPKAWFFDPGAPPDLDPQRGTPEGLVNYADAAVHLCFASTQNGWKGSPCDTQSSKTVVCVWLVASMFE